MSATDVFSPVAAFIALRETLEAGIIIAVLLGFIDQIIPEQPSPHSDLPGASNSRTELIPQRRLSVNEAGESAYSTFDRPRANSSSRPPAIPPQLLSPTISTHDLDDSDISDTEGDDPDRARHPRAPFNRDAVVRSLKMQVWSGAVLGLAAASAVGAVFLYVFYTFAHDLWQDAENLWEGIFCGVASVIILVMGLAFLRLPHARIKWRLKLLAAVEGVAGAAGVNDKSNDRSKRMRTRAARGWILFGLPFITVLREGLEGVVFLGGIGMTGSPLGIFLGAVTGFAVGGALAYLLFAKSETMTLHRFTVFSTVLLFLMGSGLASRSAYGIERQYFINGVGAAAAESGDGPGSYMVWGNIWHFMWGNPEPGHEGYHGIWQVLQSLVGWNNTASVWTVGAYCLYWYVIIGTLVSMKYKEGRTELCGRLSERGWELERSRRRARGEEGEEEGLLPPIAEGSGSRRSEEE